MIDDQYRDLFRAGLAPLVEDVPEGPDWAELTEGEIVSAVPPGRRIPGWVVGVGAAAAVLVVIGVAALLVPGGPPATTTPAATTPPTPQAFDVDTAAGEVETWWSLVINGDLTAAADMAHPEGDFNFAGLTGLVSGLGSDVTVSANRDVFGPEDLPMLCYTLEGTSGKETGAAVFREHDQTWMLWEVRPNTVGCLDTTTTTTPTTTTTLLTSEGWDAMPVGPLAPRGGSSAVWTGEEMIVWGGCNAEPCQTRFADGAAFDPDTGDWRMIAESPLDGLWHHSAVWTGREMLIVGGLSAAAYSPDSDSWRLLPDPPFRVSFTRPDGSGGRDYVGALWADDRYVIWEPISDQVAAYEPQSDSWVDLPSTGLEVDLGVLRWNGTDLVALGAISGVSPDRMRLRGVRLVDGAWEPIPDAGLLHETFNIQARPYLSGWAGEVLVAWTDSGSDLGRTMTYRPGADSWTETETVPLLGTEAWPEPMSIGDRLIVFHHGRAAIYDPDFASWTVVNIPYAEAGQTVWTGREILFWGEVCCYGTGDPFQVEAWRYTPSD